MNGKHIIFNISVLLFSLQISAQEITSIFGVVSDTSGYSVGFANIAVQGTKFGTTADKFGQYELQVPTGDIVIVVTCVGYISQKNPYSIQGGKKTKLDFTLKVAYENLGEVTVSKRVDQAVTMHRIDARSMSSMPNPSGSFENIIKQLPGVASNNELSSQYSVRGGSFDENLVYVNDIEIYRPFLIRSGQQEGLSFINPDLVGSLKFSAGGFDASYGDKMASVLDVMYKKPVENTGSFSASLLGTNVHYEGISKDGKFHHLTGIRYKTSQYLLASLDTKGEYKPTFIDAQTLLIYDLTPKLEFSFLGNYGYNKYSFIPTDRTTDYGTYQQSYQLKVFYEGQEEDLFTNALGALTLNFHPNDKLSLKLITSAYNTQESETFDILGEYNISQLDNTANQKKDTTSASIGIGGALNHARNFLNANIFAVSHIGNFNTGINKLKWGLTLQKEIINDKLDEWDKIDSAGYALPYNPNVISLMNVRYSENNLSSQRLMGYVMNTIELSPGNDKIFITLGLRSHYWSLNGQTIFNPRGSVSYRPGWKSNLMIYLAAGLYNQPAFYKELRNLQGIVNKDLKAQQSIHYVLGSDYNFNMISRPFKFTAEVYYKDYKNLVPYRIDNVRTIYAGENMAIGYATGVDFKINGEFVKGTESWFSLSLLQTDEKINFTDKNGNKTITGYYPRPSDQLLNMSLYFQDYLPNNPTYKAHLSLHYGSNLPVTIPSITNNWDNVQKIMPSYKRVDLGFSKMIKGEGIMFAPGNFLNHFKEIWISAEAFNIIGANNVISYLWVKTVSNSDDVPGYFAVPNNLTSRRLNLRLTASF
jgi:hypothetical protein